MTRWGFHPDALLEYAEAAAYYLREASPNVAERFITAVEAGISAVLSTPDRWRVVGDPGVRRYALSSFPYLVYYQWLAELDQITIYAVMHSSRKPGYWKDRIV